jgi:tight adherence protein C
VEFLLANNLLDMERILPFAIFGGFAAVAWWMLEFFTARKPRAEERLEVFKNPLLRKKATAVTNDKKGHLFGRLLEKASPFAKPLQPTNAKDSGKLKSGLSAAGFRGESATATFLGLKFTGLVVGLALGGGTNLLVNGLTQQAMVFTCGIAAFFFYLPGIVVWFLGRRRKEQIFLGLPDALDLLVVCVEAGLGLDQAMRKVSEEMKRTYPVIAEEFGMCNFQLQVGRTRSDVLHELGDRTGVDDLRALAAILIQADKFGSSIAQALRVQSESMRTRRRQLAEEKAAKTAVKLIFPLVLFIFPGIFIVLVGPAAITMVREMFPAMGGS